jgi:hypothetical protein
MMDKFFADYKKFIVEPVDEKTVGNEAFDPNKYAAYYILTLSLFDSRLTTWRDASKYEIDVEKSIDIVLKDFNQNQRENYYLQLLEVDQTKNYFIVALSSKTKFDRDEENEQISFIVDKILTNPFYIGQSWYNLIGHKGKVARKLFNCSYKEYVAEEKNDYENVSELIPKSGELKLINTSPKREVL